MKIKTRLRLNTGISLFVAMLMVLSLVWSFWDFDRNDRNVKLVEEMRKTAFERIALRDDYLLYREERAIIQWQAKSETLRGLLKTAAGRFTTIEDKALLQEARQNFDTTFSTFSAILEKQRREKRRANRNFAFYEADSRQIGQVFLKSYALMDSIGRLYATTEMAETRARNRAAFLIIFFFAGGGILIIINSTFLNRTLAKRLKVLADGIKIIGDGNLDYHLEATDADDELSGLAWASNEMAYKLKKSYTSINNLENEIVERKRAEEAIHLQSVIMSHMAEGVVLSKVSDSTIVYANPKFEEMFGYIHEELVGKVISTINAPIMDKSQEDVAKEIQRVLKTTGVWRGEINNKKKDGTLFWCYASVSTFEHSEHGTVWVATHVDVTARKLAEEEIKSLTEELEQRVAQRTAELTVKTEELERINNVFVDRELRMIELKARIKELEKKT